MENKANGGYARGKKLRPLYIISKPPPLLPRPFLLPSPRSSSRISAVSFPVNPARPPWTGNFLSSSILLAVAAPVLPALFSACLFFRPISRVLFLRFLRTPTAGEWSKRKGTIAHNVMEVICEIGICRAEEERRAREWGNFTESNVVQKEKGK